MSEALIEKLSEYGLLGILCAIILGFAFLCHKRSGERENALRQVASETAAALERLSERIAGAIQGRK